MPTYNIQTFSRHILARQLNLPGQLKCELNWLLSGIVLACKIIGQEVRRMGLSNIRDTVGNVNIHGEQQTGLDVFANNVLTECLGSRGNVALIASEEDEQPVVLMENPTEGSFIVVFDPLDGSSNIDVNVNVGTIFSIYRRDGSDLQVEHSEVLQAGKQQLAAGYVLYGSSTVLVYSIGHGVHGFTLDPTIGTFVLSHPDLQMPSRGNIYSINESCADAFPPYCRRFLHWLKSRPDEVPYRSRYIGSLVADFHRTLLKGGIFMYPSTAVYPDGKLRLLYEANPISFLAEQAGGVATNGYEPILSLTPSSLHQRVPLFIGSRLEMRQLDSFVRQRLAV